MARCWPWLSDVFSHRFYSVGSPQCSCSPFCSEPFYHMCSVGGIVVSIAAFQAVDQGSIPGQRKQQFFTQVYILRPKGPYTSNDVFSHRFYSVGFPQCSCSEPLCISRERARAVLGGG